MRYWEYCQREFNKEKSKIKKQKLKVQDKVNIFSFLLVILIFNISFLILEQNYYEEGSHYRRLLYRLLQL